jgi:hypothetical protein
MFYVEKTEGFAPNGKAIFNKLFDEFSGSSVDTDIWTVLNSTGISVANGVLTATNSSGWLESKESFGNEDIILESRFEHISMPASGYNPLSLWKSATDTFGGLIHPDSSNIKTYYRNNGNWITITGGISGIADITCRIIIHTNGTCDIQYINNDTGTVFSEALGVTNTISNEPIRFIRREDDGSSYYNQSFEVQFHHILARKYVATEPTVTVKDCGSFCQITVTNNTPDTMSDVQVSFDSTPLNLTSTDDSLLILPMNNSERSNVPYMDLFDGCVAYWDFMGDAQDIMGNHDGVVTGASLTTDHMGIQNAAYSFDGVDDYIELANSTTIDFDSNFTVCAMIKSTMTGAWFTTIIGKYGFTSISESWALGWIDSNVLGFYIRDSAGTRDIAHLSSGEALDGNWHFLVATVSSSEVKFFLDGLLKMTTPRTAGSVINSRPVTIGAHMTTFTNIDISYGSLIGRTLSDSEIKALTNLVKHGYPYPIMQKPRLIL